MAKRKWILIITIILVFLHSVPTLAMVPYETYFYDYDGKLVVSPNAYIPSLVLKSQDMGLGVQGLKEPSDLVVDKDHNVYIADKGGNRIVVLDKDYQLKFEIKDFIIGDEYDSFNGPAGIFVTEDGLIYVADSKNSRIVVFDKEANLVRVIKAPDSDVFPEGFLYEPVALGVDPAGRMYVVSKSTNMGIMALNAEGNFEGFIGAEKVVPNILDIFWELISTDEQKKRTVKNVPTEYNNITMDEIGFPYVTSSAISAGNQYSAMINGDTSSQYAPIKRLNSMGIDVLKRNGFFPPAGDLRGFNNVSRFTDVTLGEDNVYSVLDTTQNKVFTYDENGNMLYAFGGYGAQMGVFDKASAIAYQGTKLIVLDQNRGDLTIFERTTYGDSIAKAIKLRKERKYSETIDAWDEVLRQNPFFEAAYSGIAQSNMRTGDYKGAMENYKTGNDWDGYFKAFAEYRKEVVRKTIIFIPIIIGGLIWLFIALSRYIKRVNSQGWQKEGKRTLWEELLYSFHLIFHPLDGFWDLKHEKRGSVRASIIILILVMLVDIFRKLVYGYVYIPSDVRTIELGDTVLKNLIPFILWCGANWGLTTLMDGEGSFRDIFIASSYSLMPIVLLGIPIVIFSNFIIPHEVQFTNFLNGLSYGWAFGLIFFGVLVTNAYSLIKNTVTTVFSIVGMGFIAFISVLFINILQKMGNFFITIYNEIIFRI